jgi:hypothetical protein
MLWYTKIKKAKIENLALLYRFFVLAHVVRRGQYLSTV